MLFKGRLTILLYFPTNKLSRLYSKLLLETFCEVRRAIKTNHIADFINPIFIFC